MPGIPDGAPGIDGRIPGTDIPCIVGMPPPGRGGIPTPEGRAPPLAGCGIGMLGREGIGGAAPYGCGPLGI